MNRQAVEKEDQGMVYEKLMMSIHRAQLPSCQNYTKLMYFDCEGYHAFWLKGNFLNTNVLLGCMTHSSRQLVCCAL